ncbi:MAG: hypothetical protein ACU83N_12650 [Gammaproteobacteria bacterium]
MKLFAKLIVLSVFLLSLLLIGALTLIVEDEPRLQGWADMTPERIARGKRIFDQNDPRRLRTGSIATISLDQGDLDLAINYFANQYAGGFARLKIERGQAIIESTLKLPGNPLGRFLNLKLVLKQTEKFPQIERVRLGKLWIPGGLADSLIKNSLPEIEPSTDWQTLHDMIRHVKFERRRMTVTYRWLNNLPAKLSGVFFSPQDRNRLEIYQRHLAKLTRGRMNSLNLTELLRPLFQQAQERSRHGGAVAENRAVILVLTFYVNRVALAKITPQAKVWAHPVWRAVKLNDRQDLSKHYLVSAMLAAYAGTPLADAVGLFKELEDARSGSGFSFNDIAADRAGTRMGELAIRTEARAKKIQRLMATAKDSDIMPVTADLPEFMPESEFKRRFGGTEGEAYRKMMEEIEHRIAGLPINRAL